MDTNVRQWQARTVQRSETIMEKRSRPPHHPVTRAEPAKRLSLSLPESVHTRFKTACSATNRKMVTEIQKLVLRRTEELEKEAGLSDSTWARQAANPPLIAEPAAQRLAAIDRALECGHPTGDIDQVLGEIERGRDLR